MHLPVRLIGGRWPAWLERRLARFVRVDPRVILDTNVSNEDFRAVMKYLYVGGTIKITASNRHTLADDMLIRNVDLTEAILVDIGASDGTTSVELIERLDSFRRYVIADKYLELTARTTRHHVVFYDADGQVVLVAGRRFVAWPSLSRPIRLMYSSVVRAATNSPTPGLSVLLLNPEVRAMIDSRTDVEYRVHDVFTPWEGEHPSVIKVANLLRRLYFDDQSISNALTTILGSLQDGGYFLMVDNPRIPGIDIRAGLYRRDGQRYRVVEESAERPEIADLIERISSVD